MPELRPVLYSLIPGRCGPSREQSREHRGFQSRLVADACGAPVLRDQGTDRPAGPGKAELSLDQVCERIHWSVGGRCGRRDREGSMTSGPMGDDEGLLTED